MCFIPKRLFFRILPLFFAVGLLGSGTAYAQVYFNGGYASPGYNGNPTYGNQQPYYAPPPSYPVQGGYFPPPNSNYYSYPPYYSRHFHGDDDGDRYRRGFDGDHEREHRDYGEGRDRDRREYER